MRIRCMNMPVRLLGFTVLLSTGGGCSTWILDHQDAPTGGNPGGASSTSEQSETTASSMSTVPTTTDTPLATTGYLDPMPTSVPATSVPDPSSTMNDESSNPDLDSSNGDEFSAADASSSIETTETSAGTEDSLDPPHDCGVEDFVLWGESCIPRKDVRFMFVTSLEYNGSLGGKEGADKICQTSAAKGVGAHKLEGQFKAWLSTVNVNAIDGIENFAGAYVKYDHGKSDNSVIVVSAEGGRGLVSPIDVTEDAVLVMSGRRAWTGTHPDGTATGVDCDGWNDSLANLGVVGRTANYDDGWTEYEESFCGLTKRLYCIQQGPIP